MNVYKLSLGLRSGKASFQNRPGFSLILLESRNTAGAYPGKPQFMTNLLGLRSRIPKVRDRPQAAKA